MLEAIISGSAANNHSERELWTRSGELQRTGRLEKLALSTSGAEALFIGTTAAGSAAPPKNQAFQPKAPPQPCATQNRVFHQSSTTSLIGGPEPRASGPGVAGRRR